MYKRRLPDALICGAKYLPISESGNSIGHGSEGAAGVSIRADDRPGLSSYRSDYVTQAVGIIWCTEIVHWGGALYRCTVTGRELSRDQAVDSSLLQIVT